MAKKIESAVEMKTYIIEFENNKRQRITVPASWKVTFGPAAAGVNKGNNNHLKMPMALRFYERTDLQRAIFTDVKSFRDNSIQIEEERVDVREKAGFVEVEGTRKATTFQAKTKTWVDPDAEVNFNPGKALPMPSDEDMDLVSND